MNPQLRNGDLFKLLLVVAAICAAGPRVFGVYSTFITFGCVVGIFLAEHFAKSRVQEFLAILILPLAFAALGTTVPLLQSPELVRPMDYVVATVVGAICGITPVALTVVVVNVVCGLLHRVTGIQFWKYNWLGAKAGGNEESFTAPK